MATKTPHVNPRCFTIGRTRQECNSCVKGKRPYDYECTALDNVKDYLNKCPFFVPRCKYRENDADGFKCCSLQPGRYECDGLMCIDYREVGKI